MKNQPLVSVLLPTYNGAKTITKAINSVLDQTYQNFEIIIINDGSEDETEIIVSSINDKRIVYFKNSKNLGIQKSLNKGIKKSRGKYIARVDDDDEWLDREKLEKQVNFLELNPDYVLIGTGAVVVDGQGREIFRFLNLEKDSDIRRIILGKNCFLHPSVVFRKNAALTVGGYSEKLECLHIEDYDLWLKLGKIGKFANLSIYGLRRTKSKNQISARNQTKQLREYLGIIRKYKKNYPRHIQAIIRSYLRIFLYRWLDFDKIKYYIKKNEI